MTIGAGSNTGAAGCPQTIGPWPVSTVRPGPGCVLVGGMLVTGGGVLATGASGTSVPADDGATVCVGETSDVEIDVGASVGEATGAGAVAAGVVRFENHAEIEDQFV